MGAFITFPAVFLLIVLLAIAGYALGRNKALTFPAQSTHSRPHQHAWHVVFATAAPSLLIVTLWLFFAGIASNIYTNAVTPDDLIDVRLSAQDREGLTDREIEIREAVLRTQFIAGVRSLASALDGYVADGNATDADISGWNAEQEPIADRLRAGGQVLGPDVTNGMLSVAQIVRQFDRRVGTVGPIISLVLAIAGFAIALRRISAEFRARVVIERWITGFLIFASTMAVLATVAILAALTLPSLNFFREYGFFNFLFGMTWGPAGDVVGIPEGRDGSYQSALGFVPLIWGTLYISLVALLVAVPLGLLAAVYLSEFASRMTRSWVKPALEILAGVPTIVYGIFALITIGPFLQAVVGATVMPNTVSVMNAGVVMGMMLVPFISSLSDDVINAVPQAMRDGSLAIGATQAETVTQVILPAALPGIVGAIVLAASRAIGETMIVVLAAGALSNVQGIEPNPFGAVVTVTTRIVAVLTGEGSGFDSIDVLAVFALAFTLFFITLALNLLAQRMVAKYREQYD
jgi:phosphate transport system permease protein